MQVDIPQTINLVTCKVYNKDGSLDKEITTTNRYLYAGWTTLLNGEITSITPSTNQCKSLGSGIIYLNSVGLNSYNDNADVIGCHVWMWGQCYVTQSNQYFPDNTLQYHDSITSLPRN